MTLDFIKFKAFVESKIPNSQKITEEKTHLLSYVFKIENIDFENVLINLENRHLDFFLWRKPAAEHEIIAFEPLVRIEFNDENYQKKTSDILHDFRENHISNKHEFRIASLPVLLGGFKFRHEKAGESDDGFCSSDWIIPGVLLIREVERCFLVFNFIIRKSDFNLWNRFREYSDMVQKLLIKRKPGSSPKPATPLTADYEDFPQWETMINKALGQISGMVCEKIVISRKSDFKFRSKPSINAWVKDLSVKYPFCYIFAYRKSGSLFFGASPEKLIVVRNGWIETDGLAGSIKRGEKQSDDDKLQNELLNDKKNLAEHAAVVSFIIGSVSKFSDEILYEKLPGIRKLKNIQHLWTPVRARLNNRDDLFSLIKELHPTPAVSGFPQEKAISLIQEIEKHTRGFYAGVLGWIDIDYNAELAVGIRAALLKGFKLSAYAGCGIVDGSVAESEYEESLLKLNPITSLFEHEKIYQS